MTEPSKPVAEIITLAVDAESFSPQTLDLAADLAVTVQGHLQGVFIENSDLFSAAGLPFSCEITFGAGESRALTTATLESHHKNLAERFHNALVQRARQSVLECSFSSVRSRRSEVLGQQSSHYFILERQARLPLRAKAQHPAVVRILVVDGQRMPRLQQTLQLLCKRLAHHHIELYYLQLNDDAPPLPVAAGNVRVIAINLQQAGKLLDGAIDYLVMSRSLEPALFKQLVGATACPVIVVE